jgi:hypothetical protein
VLYRTALRRSLGAPIFGGADERARVFRRTAGAFLFLLEMVEGPVTTGTVLSCGFAVGKKKLSFRGGKV